MQSPTMRLVSFPQQFLFVLLATTIVPQAIELTLSAQTGCASPAAGVPCVLTSQYDVGRDSYNGNEVVLTPSSVVGMSTSPLFQLRVDIGDLPFGAVSNPLVAQPLYVASVASVGSPPATHNLLIAATLNGTVFAWDADNKTCGTSGDPVLCWSRQQPIYPNVPGPKGIANALWWDDCGQTGSGPVPTAGANVPFEGILSTPVVDVALATPAIFLTSFCATSAGSVHWFLHSLNVLTGADNVPAVEIVTGAGGPPGTNNADDLNNNTITFVAGHENQRPALLRSLTRPGWEIADLHIFRNAHRGNNAWTQPVPRVAFRLRYLTYAQLAFVTTTRGCGTGGGSVGGAPSTQCSLFNVGTASPTCDCKLEPFYSVPNTFFSALNWGGHGGGIWMSGRGPAANLLADGYHIFLGVGNGGFQQFQSDGPNNFGESILDFRLTSSGPDVTPYQSFTPNGLPSGIAALGPSPVPGCQDPVTGNPTNCAYSFENLNALDQDLSTSGILAFIDLSGYSRLVTLDKAGHGYLLLQNHFCGPSIQPANCNLQTQTSPAQGFSGGPGTYFPLAQS